MAESTADVTPSDDGTDTGAEGTEDQVVEEQATPDPEADETDDTEDGDGEAFDEARARAKIAKTNREAASLRARLKAAEEKATKWDDYEESNKSDTEKVADRIRVAEEKAANLEKDYNLLVIQHEFGLTASQAKRITGSTLEELRGDAEEFVTENGIEKPAPGSTKKTPSAKDVKGGLDAKDDPVELDPAKLAAGIRRR